ncbi:ABC transporter permease [Actinomyces timonensis]|uniref:ABC transporter permease n=1 Tax=Actinomyces timonensis TaxID=1288391 RepID=A0AAU8N5T4_9ACTO
MSAVFTHQLRLLARERSMLVWTLLFPLILATVFMVLFQGIDDAEPTPIPLGAVTDHAYDDAPGLRGLMEGVSSPDAKNRLTVLTEYPDEDAARAAAENGGIQGYVVVKDGAPLLQLTARGAASDTSTALRWALDSYARSAALGESISARTADGATSPEDAGSRIANARRILDRLGSGPELIEETQVTPSSGTSTARYYFALLAFTAALGMSIAMVSVRSVMAGSSPTGTRRALAAIPRWRILAGVLAAAWVMLTACLVSGFLYMRGVCGVGFGIHWPWALLAVAASSLLFSTAGAVLGTVPRLSPGITTALSSLLSLFTGLYGQSSQRLADSVEKLGAMAGPPQPPVAVGPRLLLAALLRHPVLLRHRDRGHDSHDRGARRRRHDPHEEDEPCAPLRHPCASPAGTGSTPSSSWWRSICSAC